MNEISCQKMKICKLKGLTTINYLVIFVSKRKFRSIKTEKTFTGSNKAMQA